MDEVVRQAQAAGYKDLFSVKKVKPARGLLHLIRGKMHEQVADSNHRVVLFLADGNWHYRAILG